MCYILKGEAIKQGYMGGSDKIISKIADARVQVVKTDSLPFSPHGLVMIEFTKMNEGTVCWGSGTLIAPYLVLTAAHNLKSKEKGDAISAVFIPAMNGHHIPFSLHVVRDMYYSINYKPDKETDDYGLLILENPVGEMTGYYGLNVEPVREICGKKINVTGYPVDKAKAHKGKYEMWGMEGTEKAVDDHFIDYEIHTSHGQSGSGVWYKENADYLVIGVHVLGGENSNKATVLTYDRYQEIDKWVTLSIDKQRAKNSPNKIDLSNKEIGKFGAQLLLKNNNLTTISTLNLSKNKIGDDWTEALAKNTTLTSLDLSSVAIGKAGVEALAQNTTLGSLILADNIITIQDVEVLAQNTTLKFLSLARNRISDDGAKALAMNTTLTSLNLVRNTCIGDQGETALKDSPNQNLKKYEKILRGKYNPETQEWHKK